MSRPASAQYLQHIATWTGGNTFYDLLGDYIIVNHYYAIPTTIITTSVNEKECFFSHTPFWGRGKGDLNFAIIRVY